VDGSDPAANHATVERELELHNPRLAVLPRVLAMSKADLVDAQAREAARETWAKRVDAPVLVTSSATGLGLSELAAELVRRVPAESPDAVVEVVGAGEELAEHRVFRPAAERAYRVAKVGERTYRVSGPGIERLVARYDLDNADALAYLERRLRGIGVIRALEQEGFEPGDDVEIAGIAFDLDPE